MTGGCFIDQPMCVMDMKGHARSWWLMLVAIFVVFQVTHAVNNRPTCPKSYYSKEINENVPVGTTIVDLGCSDPDGDTLTYSIFNGNSDTQFNFPDASSGVLVTNLDLDAERPLYWNTAYYSSPFTLVIYVKDNGSPAQTLAVTVYVRVMSLNDFSPAISNLPASVSYAEDTTVGTVVATCDLSDGDRKGSGHEIPYIEISAGNSENKFAIDYITCDLMLIGLLNYEKTTSYTLTLRAFDTDPSTPLETLKDIVITVTDVNDNTPACTAYNIIRSVDETKTAGTVLETLSCTDADTGAGGTIVYEIISGDTSRLTVDASNGQVALINDLDFDTGDKYLEVTVRVRDQGSPSLSATVTVGFSITDVDDNPPVFSKSDFTATVMETADIGAVVLTLEATDTDSPNTDLSKITYGFEGACTPNWFKLDSVTGSILVRQILDWETQSVVVCTVHAYSSDKYDDRATATVTITLIDVNDRAPIFNKYLFEGTVSENATIGTTILTITADDPDSGANGDFTFSISGASPFTINPSTGDITLTGAIDYETDIAHLFVVKATDKGTPSLSSETFVNIKILPVNEFDPVLDPVPDQNVLELTTPGTTIITFTANDGDSGADGEVEYQLQDESVPFVLERELGVLRAGVGMDREVKAVYDLVVIAKDKSTTSVRSTSSTVRVTLKDENDNSPICDYVPPIIVTPSNTDVGDPIADLNCVDADSSTQVLKYTEAGGDTNNIFTVDWNNGVIRLQTSPVEGKYTLLISVRDQGSPEMSTTMPIEISVEADLQFDNLPQVKLVPENTNVPDVVFTASASGAYDLVTYQITSGNSAGEFSLHPTSGELRLVKSLDRETVASYAIGIRASTTNGQSMESTLTITVTDYNDNTPVYSNSYQIIQISELIAIPTTLMTITATDKDTGLNAALTYSIVSGNTGNVFSYDANGNLKVVSGVDYEAVPFYTLVLQAKDKGTPALNSTTIVYIDVQNADEHLPQIIPAGGKLVLTLPENTAIGAPVFKINASDLDTGSELSYSITSGNDDGYFSIDQNKGVIYLALPLDRETKNSVSLGIQVANTLGQINTTVLDISITDVNDNDPMFSQGNYIFEVSHGLASGATVGTLTVTDADLGTNSALTLTITSGNPLGHFTLSGKVLKAAATLDANITNFYELLVTATDGGSPSRSSQAYVTIWVKSEFQKPVFLPKSASVSVLETRIPGSLIYDCDATVNGATEGPAGDTEYAITSGNNEGKFYMETFTGTVQLIAPLDFGKTSSYTLAVKAANRGKPTLTDTFILTITVTQVNKYDPQFLQEVYTWSVSEAAAIGTTVGRISATDKDPGQYGTVAYAIESNSKFNVKPTSGYVTLASALEYSTAKSHHFYVTAIDNAGVNSKTASSVVVINVIDTNNHSPIFAASPYTITLAETLSKGTSFLTVVATDLDSGAFGTLQYSITSGNSNNIFTVDSSTGVLSLKSTLDYETTTQYIIKVEAKDGGTPSRTGTATVTINVQDLNDHVPNFGTSRVDISVTSNTTASTSIYTVTATDKDTGNNGIVRYAIQSGNDDSLFTISTMTGEIKTAASLAKAGSSYTLIVIGVDQGLPTLTGTVTIGVTVPRVETPTPQEYDFAVNENLAAGTVVGTIPKDPTLSITGYNITSGNFGTNFAITMNAGLDGILSTSNVLDRETYPYYQLSVAVQHSTGVKDVDVTVVVTDDNDNAPIVTPVNLDFEVLVNLPAGTRVGAFTINDPDDTGVNNQMDVILSPSFPLAAVYFSVDSSGVISLTQPIPSGAFSTLIFEVIATDRGTPAMTSTGTVTVDLIDTPNPATTTTFITREFPHDAASGDTVCTLSPSDFEVTVGGGDTVEYISVGSNVFNIDSSTGKVTVSTKSLIFDKSRYFQWVVLKVTSGGTSTSYAGLVRLDTFNKDDHMIAVVVSTDEVDLESKRADLTTQLQTFYPAPNAVKIWDVQSIGSSSRRRLLAAESAALTVVVADESANDIENVDMAKTFLTQSQALTPLQASADGTPVSSVTTGSLPVSKVMPYETVNKYDDDDDLSTAMIVLIAFAALAALFLLVLLIAVIVYFLCIKRKKGDDTQALVNKEEDKVKRKGSFGTMERNVSEGDTDPFTKFAQAQQRSKNGPLVIAAHNAHTRNPSLGKGKSNSITPADSGVSSGAGSMERLGVRNVAFLNDNNNLGNIPRDPDADGAPSPATRAVYITSTPASPESSATLPTSSIALKDVEEIDDLEEASDDEPEAPTPQYATYVGSS